MRTLLLPGLLAVLGLALASPLSAQTAGESAPGETPTPDADRTPQEGGSEDAPPAQETSAGDQEKKDDAEQSEISEEDVNAVAKKAGEIMTKLAELEKKTIKPDVFQKDLELVSERVRKKGVTYDSTRAALTGVGDTSFGYHTGAFTWALHAGVEFADADDRFSNPTPYVRYFGDTVWHPKRLPVEIHFLADFALASSPVDAEEEDEGDMGESDAADFIESEKSFRGALGMDMLCNVTGNDGAGYDTFVGLALRGGLESIDDGGDENEFWGAGLTFRTAKVAAAGQNPLPTAFGTVLWGENGLLDTHVITFDGIVRFHPDTSAISEDTNLYGAFLGLRAIVDLDSSRDDLAVQVGFQDGFALLRDLFELPGKLFGAD